MKFNSLAKTYALATQGILTMVVMLGLGYFIGYLIDKDSAWPAILAVVGVLCGLFTFVTYLLYLIKEEEKRKKNDQGPKD
ncbi:MAG: AtpZ/AtpI family protein [Acholeplasmatales bacterium]|jgi:membrane protein DedA with SNARE-associated domain|nr:AtpZ/AtpI family protein [Acholeplasmatales bacterium]